MPTRTLVAAFLLGAIFAASSARSKPRNKVFGTWRMVSAQIDTDGKNLPAYGPMPNGLLVFTADLHFVEVLTDSTVPKFTSNARGHGTAEENQVAMAGSIGFFGSYTVDENGNLSGDRVEGSTFPNWVGDHRAASWFSQPLGFYRSALLHALSRHRAGCR